MIENAYVVIPLAEPETPTTDEELNKCLRRVLPLLGLKLTDKALCEALDAHLFPDGHASPDAMLPRDL